MKEQENLSVEDSVMCDITPDKISIYEDVEKLKWIIL